MKIRRPATKINHEFDWIGASDLLCPNAMASSTTHILLKCCCGERASSRLFTVSAHLTFSRTRREHNSSSHHSSSLRLSTAANIHIYMYNVYSYSIYTILEYKLAFFRSSLFILSYSHNSIISPWFASGCWCSLFAGCRWHYFTRIWRFGAPYM